MARIKHYKSPTDPDGSYREYVVYEENGAFFFDRFAGAPPRGNLLVSSREEHKEFTSEKGAVVEYNKYLAGWEDEA